MFRVLSPLEAQAVIAAGGIDVVDVREPHEFAIGHIPGARSVPLNELTNDPRGKLPHDPVLLVCARGLRSQTAAKAAEAAGLKDVIQLDGGTQAWWGAGLPVEKSPTPVAAPPRSSAPPPPPPAADPTCGLPPPGLDVVVGGNLRELRMRQHLTLDQLARLTNLSRTLLGQIELGKTQPSVSVVWKIANALHVPFSALLASEERRGTTILRGADAKRLESPDGRFSSRPLYPLTEKPQAEFYELFFSGHSREDAQPHEPGTRENLVVTSGRLEVDVDGVRHELAKGDAIIFGADVPHAYINPGSEDCWAYLVMTYVTAPDGPPEA